MPRRVKPPRRLWIIAAAVFFLLAAGGIGALKVWYERNLSPVSASTQEVFFTVEAGSGVHKIAQDLREAGLIRSTSAFETYLTANNLRGKLQAGTYKLSPALGTKKIIEKMVGGDVAKNLLTILPGKHLAEIKSAFRKAGYSRAEVETAFNPSIHAGHPALAGKPRTATLEGYLYPDSFQKDSNTAARTIVRQSLDEMHKHLSSGVTVGFAARKLSTYQAVVLASIVLKETDDPQDMPRVAQVLLTRMARDIPLQADATAFYASDRAGVPRSLKIQSAYNTYLHRGLPPGPISNVTIGALRAVAQPAQTDFLYYVTGDDGHTRFSHTLEEHQAAVLKYCQKRCQ